MDYTNQEKIDVKNWLEAVKEITSKENVSKADLTKFTYQTLSCAESLKYNLPSNKNREALIAYVKLETATEFARAAVEEFVPATTSNYASNFNKVAEIIFSGRVISDLTTAKALDTLVVSLIDKASSMDLISNSDRVTMKKGINKITKQFNHG